MGLLDTLRVGSSGLAAAGANIDATAQNVANSSTVGFHRRSVEQTVADPVISGIVAIGQGVSIDGIVRDNVALLGAQQVELAGDASAAASLHDALIQVEPLFDETTSDGLRTSIDAFFDALVEATTDPSELGLRAEVVATAEDVAQTVSATAVELDAALAQFEEDIELSLPPLTQQLQEVAALNERIIAKGGAEVAPDLADQRDAIIRDLGEEVGIVPRYEADGSATLLLDGHAVVTGNEARTLSYSPPTGVAISVDGGNVIAEPGGRIGGLAEAHEKTAGYLDELNTFATEFATALNAQHAAGFDLNGVAGGDIFTFNPTNPAATLVLSSTLTAESLAFAGDATAFAGDGVNLLALTDLEDQATVGGQTAGAFLSSLTNTVASDVATAASDAERTNELRADLDGLVQNLHGVDLDEEASRLIEFQAAYQAAAKVIQITNQMLGTLMEIT